jgi:protein crumbs
VCVKRNGVPVCRCQPGMIGVDCSQVDQSVCKRGGIVPTRVLTCTAYKDDECNVHLKVECKTGWTGDLCERPMRTCADLDCANGSTCIMRIDRDQSPDYTLSPLCLCRRGYAGDRCERLDVDACKSPSINPCANGATCASVDGHAECACTQGW